MKYENVISKTDAKGGQVCFAFDHNEDQLQLFPKMAALRGCRRRPSATDYVFLIRVVSIRDECPF